VEKCGFTPMDYRLAVFTIVMFIIVILVGGFNNLEKYESQ